MSAATRANLEVVLLGVSSGLLGVHVVLRRLAFFAMAMSHATFPGVILAAWIGVPLLGGSLAFALVVVAALLVISGPSSLDGSTAVGVVLSGSFGLGALLHGLQVSPRQSLAGALVGQIAALRSSDVVVTAAVAAAVIGFLSVAHRPLLLGAFDGESARAVGYGRRYDALMLVAITAVLVTTLPVVGSVLAVSLLVVPALTARLWTDRLLPTFAISVALAVLAGLVGLSISRRFDLAAGAAVALVAAAAFGLSWLVAKRGLRSLLPRAVH